MLEKEDRLMRASPKLSITIPTDLLADVRCIANTEDRSVSNTIAHLTRIGISIHDNQSRILKESPAKYTTKRDNEN